MGGECDAVVGAAEGRARRPHDGHRRGVGHHRAAAALWRGLGIDVVAGEGAGEGKPRRRSVGLGSSGVWGEVKSHAAPL